MAVLVVVVINVPYASLWSIAWTSEGNSVVKHQYQFHMTPLLNKNKERAAIVGWGRALTYSHSEMKCFRRKSLETMVQP